MSAEFERPNQYHREVYTTLPFVGGYLADVWPVPFGPQGGDGYTVGQARDAMTRAITMARRYAADPARRGAGRGMASVTWAASPRQDLVLFACVSLAAGMARQVGMMAGDPFRRAALPMRAHDSQHIPDLVKLLSGGEESFDFCQALGHEAEQTEDPSRMRSLALVAADMTAELYTAHARMTGMTPLMLADLQLAAMPHAFPWDQDETPQGTATLETTQGDAADHAPSPREGESG